MKLVVTGGRNYRDLDNVYRVLDAWHAKRPITLLIHGACGWDADRAETWLEVELRGADGLADHWAGARGVPVRREAAHWSTLKGPAGPARNLRMAQLGPSAVLCFPGGSGTAGMVRVAKRLGIPTFDYVPPNINLL